MISAGEEMQKKTFFFVIITFLCVLSHYVLQSSLVDNNKKNGNWQKFRQGLPLFWKPGNVREFG